MKEISKTIIFAILFLVSCQSNGNINNENKKAEWIKKAIVNIETNIFPRVKAISWWHENFDNSLLRIDSSSESLETYKNSVNSSIFLTTAQFSNNKLIEPTSGIYHSAYPDFGGTEDVVTAQRISEFETLANKNIVWAYFSNNWYDSIKFPMQAVNIINTAGKVPFIRIMPRTNFDEGGPDPNYSMQKIINGDFDTELTQWAIDAFNTGIPLLAEFGTEINGNWFPWNGQYNGGGETTEYGDLTFPDGPERFRDAYRHIIDICNANGATNITWFFHVDAYSEPESSWNVIENYYPGDSYIDWLGVSVYGPQESNESYQEFSEILNDIYPALAGLSNKPIAILEFAITEIE